MNPSVVEGHAVFRESGCRYLPEVHSEPSVFRTVRGWVEEWDDPETLLISETPLQLEWEVFLAISTEVVYLDWVKPSWKITLHAVAPDAPDPAVLEAALQFTGLYPEELSQKDRIPAKIEALVRYGATATLAEFFSTRARSAVLSAISERIEANTLPIYLNAVVNQLGQTGWDFLQGLVPQEVSELRKVG